MSTIQILELRPVEDKIEELSYDMTGSIRGGVFEAYLCVIDLWKAIVSATSQEQVIQAQIDFVECLDLIF